MPNSDVDTENVVKDFAVKTELPLWARKDFKLGEMQDIDENMKTLEFEKNEKSGGFIRLYGNFDQKKKK